jgi:glucosamine--fructose-6-phosphate aminotransferase (isomerizing)
MCGIIGIVGERNVPPVLLEGLKRLEYRGYDSAGIAVSYQGALSVRRATGKLVNLQQKLLEQPMIGFVGIGHTRWATHGAPTEINAHPHATGRVAVVHNGIIENHQELRRELQAEGVLFESETDTEVIPHLIERLLDQGHEPGEAVCMAVRRLKGAFALGVILRDREDLLIATRCSSPLIVGLGEGENFIASDATPLVPYTRRMIYLQDHDVVFLEKSRCVITDAQGRKVERGVQQSQVSADLTEKWPYRHFMQKEIFEQPTVVGETLRGLLDPGAESVDLERESRLLDFASLHAIHLVACGTSWHAALVGKYWIEQFARIPVSVDIASEFRYREPPFLPNTLVIALSQSGETADTLAALRYVRQMGQRSLGIVNVLESSIAREADCVLYTKAGPEIGVASTKAFTTQLAVLAVLALALGKARGVLSPEMERHLVSQLLRIPVWIEQALAHNDTIQEIARDLMHAHGFLFLGRGTCFPIALEGALKLKEISYIHAEGYAAGEMKHGPIALIDEELPVVVLAPRDGLFDKVVSNIEEVKARGGRVVMITTASGITCRSDYSLHLADMDPFVTPVVSVVPLQLLAYHIAVLKGTDVDQPRNLAKSVTVE